MKRVNWILMALVLCLRIAVVPCLAEKLSSSNSINIKGGNPDQNTILLYAQEGYTEQTLMNDTEEDEEYLEEDEELDEIADPIEPLNRVFFYFNDKFYFWLMKPVAKGYSAIAPEGVRIAVRNFFDNISTPIRFVNNLLQLKIKPAGKELIRFGVNSTVGVIGLFDYARDNMGIKMQNEDFGQTLGVWGVGPVIYINWPILGPSSIRGTIGYAGDYFLNPLNYVTPEVDRLAIKAGKGINGASLAIGDYEAIKKDALDPYNAVKDIYYQYRKSKISR
jgi:phospholipid-binding lipoprotein MlaA